MDNQEQYYVKTCPKCRQTKSMDDFSPNERLRDGCHTYCRVCVRQYYKRHPRIKQNCAYKARYGITLGQKEEMIKQQNGCCYLCDNILPSNFRDKVIDHDKITGQVFGIACRKCNLGISHFDHDPYLMIKIAERMLRLRKIE